LRYRPEEYMHRTVIYSKKNDSIGIEFQELLQRSQSDITDDIQIGI
jgi:hypothetical protein